MTNGLGDDKHGGDCDHQTQPPPRAHSLPIVHAREFDSGISSETIHKRDGTVRVKDFSPLLFRLSHALAFIIICSSPSRSCRL